MQLAHRGVFAYLVVLCLALLSAFLIDVGRSPTGLAIWERDLSIKINSISPEIPQYLDKRMTIDFKIEGTENTGLSTTYTWFALTYPSGKVVGYTAFIKNSLLQQKSTVKQFMWNLDQKGTYKLRIVVDPHNNILETNELNNRDEIIFKI